MKKWMALGTALLLVLPMATAAATDTVDTTRPSKTVAEITTVETTGTSVPVVISVVEDKAPVVQEISKLTEFVQSGAAPVTYFPPAVQEAVAAFIPGVAVQTMEVNEIITLAVEEYNPSAGDVQVIMSFATVYKPSQKVVAVVGIYSGAVDANGDFIVEWVTLETVVLEDGTVMLVYPADVLTRMQNASTVSLAMINSAE